MIVRFIYTRPEDGGLDIVSGAPKDHLDRLHVIGEFGPLSREDYIRTVRDRIPKDAINVQQMPDDWEPDSDRYFRNAWKQEGRGVTVDMAKAREVQKQKLRQLRAPLLAKLDTDYMRADEADDRAEKARIAARKQALRDITKSAEIEAAHTPNELKVAGIALLGL